MEHVSTDTVHRKNALLSQSYLNIDKAIRNSTFRSSARARSDTQRILDNGDFCQYDENPFKRRVPSQARCPVLSTQLQLCSKLMPRAEHQERDKMFIVLERWWIILEKQNETNADFTIVMGYTARSPQRVKNGKVPTVVKALEDGTGYTNDEANISICTPTRAAQTDRHASNGPSERLLIKRRCRTRRTKFSQLQLFCEAHNNSSVTSWAASHIPVTLRTMLHLSLSLEYGAQKEDFMNSCIEVLTSPRVTLQRGSLELAPRAFVLASIRFFSFQV